MNYKDKFKEMMANPRYKSLFKLGLYFIFVVIVLFSLKVSKTSETVKHQPIDRFNSHNIYKYQVKTTLYSDNQLLSSSYEAISYKSKYKIIHNEQVYYYDRLSSTIIDYADITLNEVELLVKDITPQKIYNLIINEQIISKTDLYSEHLTAKEYQAYLYETEVKIITYEDSNNIVRIKLSFDYNNYQNVEVVIDYNFNEQITEEMVSLFE